MLEFTGWISELETRIRQLPSGEGWRNAKILEYEIKKQHGNKSDLDKKAKANHLDLQVSIIGKQF